MLIYQRIITSENTAEHQICHQQQFTGKGDQMIWWFSSWAPYRDQILRGISIEKEGKKPWKTAVYHGVSGIIWIWLWEKKDGTILVSDESIQEPQEQMSDLICVADYSSNVRLAAVPLQKTPGLCRLVTSITTSGQFLPMNAGGKMGKRDAVTCSQQWKFAQTMYINKWLAPQSKWFSLPPRNGEVVVSFWKRCLGPLPTP